MKKNFVAVLFVALFAPSDTEAKTLDFKVWADADVYTQTIKDWNYALQEVGGVSSTSYIKKEYKGQDRLHPAKHRDVIYWIPKTTDLSKPFTMIIWFHGHGGFYKNRTFIDRTLAQLVPKALDSKNFVLVLPEMPWSRHGKTPTSRNGQIWAQKGDFLHFMKQASEVFSEHHAEACGETCKPMGKASYKIVGHSAGGSTLAKLGKTGDLCELKPTVVTWSDSSYGHWLDKAWKGCLSKTDITVKVFVVNHGSPYKQSKRFFRSFKTVPKNLELHVLRAPKWYHKKIGDNIVSLAGLLD